MLFRRTLLREFTQSAVGIFLVLLAVTLTTQLIRFLGQAAKGSIATDAVLAMLGFSALGYLPVLLSLAVYLAILMTLTRSYRDSEMIIWFTSGLSLTAWLRPVATFVLPIVVTIAGLSLVLSPWAIQQSERYKQQYESRDDVSNIAPGVFKESKHSERVYFVENYSGPGGTVKNIFVQSTQHGTFGTMVAANGYEYQAKNGDRFLVLQNGRRYDGMIGAADYKLAEFERYSMRIEPYESALPPATFKSMSTLDLISKPIPPHLAELVWRVGLPISALLLSFMAVPLSFVNPRSGRSGNIILALLLYMIYNNLISLTQAWVASGKTNAVTGFTLIHLVMLTILVALLYRRLAVFALFRQGNPLLRLWAGLRQRWTTS